MELGREIKNEVKSHELPKEVVITKKEFIKAISEAKPKEVITWDEAIVRGKEGLGMSGLAMKTVNDSVVSILHRFRKEHEDKIKKYKRALFMFGFVLIIDAVAIYLSFTSMANEALQYISVLGVTSLLTILAMLLFRIRSRKMEINNIDEFYNGYNLKGVKD